MDKNCKRRSRNYIRIEQLIDEAAEKNLSVTLKIFYYYYKDLIINDLSYECFHILDYETDFRSFYKLYITLLDVYHAKYMNHENTDKDRLMTKERAEKIYKEIEMELRLFEELF